MIAPENEQDLAEAVASAQGGLRIEGGGTRGLAGSAGEVLSLAALQGVDLYDPGAMTIVVRAGTPLAEVETVLARENQRLAFEPMDHRPLLGTAGEPTIGGVVAANVSGPRRIQAGACRDSLIGVRFVDGRGAVVKNGGRVMKNVTGYDLVKLMAGSHGTLGVLSEVSLKVLPRDACAASVSIRGLSDGRAVQAMAAALGSPHDVSGAAHLPSSDGAQATTMIRLEGFDTSIAHRSERICDLLAGFGEVAVESDPARVAAAWQSLRDVETFHGRPGDVWRISVKPSDAPALVDRLPALGVQYDWGGGLIWVLTSEGSDLRPKMADVAGHATLVRASPETRARIPTFHPEPAPLAAISAGLRAKFDPRAILNPGVMD